MLRGRGISVSGGVPLWPTSFGRHALLLLTEFVRGPVGLPQPRKQRKSSLSERCRPPAMWDRPLPGLTCWRTGDYRLVIHLPMCVLFDLVHTHRSTVMAEQQFGEVAFMPVAQMAALLTAVDNALQAEGIDDTVITRVRNRLVWGNPDGADAVVRLTPGEYEQIRIDIGGTGPWAEAKL